MNIAYSMKIQNHNRQTAREAGRQYKRILSRVLAPSTYTFFQKVNLKGGMCGLDLGCATGENTLQLKTIVGMEGKMTGLDSNSFNIKIAKEKALQNNTTPIEYRQQNILEWKEYLKYDFVYSRLLFNQLSDPLSILKQVHYSLKTGGLAMVEDLDFSQFHCFPNCYAFDRLVELYTAINKRQSTDPSIGKQLYPLFQQVGFKKIQAQMVAPSFLTGNNKRIASLTLENIATILIDEKLTTPTEIQALLFELKAFEKRKNTLIALPGIYQVWGFRF